MVTMQELLSVMYEKGASDLHVTTGIAPTIRVDGGLIPLPHEPLMPQDTKRLCYSVLTEVQKQRFEEEWELDLSFGVKGLSRFRANVYMQRGAVAGAFRTIPFRVRPFEELGLPPHLKDLCKKPRGLVLVTGPTGSGKSTTLAAMLDKINNERQEHIITIEDPIEYLHPHKKCLVNQREVNADTQGFKKALKYILRQDPDVVLIGEMRDLETIEAALTVAETGPPRVRDPPHELVRPDDQPDPRRVPALPAAAGPRAALLRPRGGHLPDPHPPGERERARARARGDDPEPGDPEPDPGGEGPPDLLPDAGGTGEVRDADDEPVAARDVPAQGDHAGRRGGPQLRPRRIPATCSTNAQNRPPGTGRRA